LISLYSKVRFKETLIAPVRDLFTFPSKVIKSFIKVLECKKRKQITALPGFEPLTFGLKFHYATAWTKAAWLKLGDKKISNIVI
jgi:hypothetical protein